jgi:hypothetical protein
LSSILTFFCWLEQIDFIRKGEKSHRFTSKKNCQCLFKQILLLMRTSMALSAFLMMSTDGNRRNPKVHS